MAPTAMAYSATPAPIPQVAAMALIRWNKSIKKIKGVAALIACAVD